MGFKDDSKICGLKTMWNNYLLECRKTVERTDLGGAGYTDLIWALLILRCLLDIQMGMFSR